MDQPPGRYVVVRIRLVGNERRTPVVRRVRLDFPRVTSLEHLPAVYRENPEAEDFTERFLSLFDASIEEMDQVIERFPALLDPDGVPDDVLPWIGAFLDAALDPALDSERRRQLLLELPRLYRQRGTVGGLIRMVELIFGVRPAIDERFLSRSWAAVGRDAHVRFARLFGRSRARFRLDRSSLGGAPLRSFGNPDHDPFATEAYRFTVRIPATSTLGLTDMRRLDRLIAHEKPAHTVHALHVGGQGFVVGPWSALGIDTVFGTTEPPVLGGRSTAQPGTVRLNRISILRSGPHGCTGSLRVGEAGAIGIHTVLE